MFLKKSSKVNQFRNFALLLVFVGIAIMYMALLFKAHPILMTLFMGIGFIAILLSSGVYLWVGLLSTKVIPVICPNCSKQTKVLGHVDLCMHCNEPLTIDPTLEGKPFDKKYNRLFYKSQESKDQSH